MRVIRLWPAGFTGRVTLVLLGAILVQFLAAAYLLGIGERHLQQADLARRIAEQLVVAERVIGAAPQADRARLVSDLSTAHLYFSLEEEKPPLSGTSHPMVTDVRAEIIRWEPALAAYEMQFAVRTARQVGFVRNLEGALHLPGGPWIYFRTQQPLLGWAVIVSTMIWVGLTAAAVLLFAAVMVQTLGAPLRKLASHADQIGTGPPVHFAENGPKELRRVALALNEMQARIAALIDERTTALAAVGHDLRTPLARLRLRLSTVADTNARAAAERDVREMEDMLSALLEFLNGGEEWGERVKTDLASLLQVIVEEAQDLGGNAEYLGPAKLVANVYFDDLRRALVNLVDNAVKYGGAAHVDAWVEDQFLIIRVDDYGPGIDSEILGAVKQPFYRADQARGGDTHGFGLGLSIAEQVARRHDGELVLANRPEGGLSASLKLPRSGSQPSA